GGGGGGGARGGGGGGSGGGWPRRSVVNNPGVSRNSIVAGVVFFGLNSWDSQSSRSSGSLAMPTCPRCPAAGSGLTPVSQWNTVLLPEPEKPAMPTFMGLVSRPLSVVRSQGAAGGYSTDNGPRTTDHGPCVTS